MEFGKRLQRQITKFLDFPQGVEIAKGLQDILSSDSASFAENFEAFLRNIDESYTQFDSKVEMAQKNLELSQTELVAYNSQLFSVNETFDAVLNSLEQGLVVFDKEGICQSVSSQQAKVFFNGDPNTRHLKEILELNLQDEKVLEDWLQFAFDELLPFESAANLLFSKILLNGRHLSLNFRPIRDQEGKILRILMVATDVSEKIQSDQREQELIEYSKRLLYISKNKSQFINFVQQNTRQIDQFVVGNNDLIKSPTEVLRFLHNAKGGASFLGLMSLRRWLHEKETEVSRRDPNSSFEALATAILKAFQVQIAELKLEMAEIIDLNFREGVDLKEVSEDKLYQVYSWLSSMQVPRESIQSYFSNEILSDDLNKSLESFNAVLQTTAAAQGRLVKAIDFSGDRVRIHRRPYQSVMDSMVHIFTNIVVHGLEHPDSRELVGKDPSGTVHIAIKDQRQVNGGFWLAITDDGRGVDFADLRERVRLYDSQVDQLSDSQVLQWIFKDQVSTAKDTTELAGRGVGLSALKAAVESLNGWIEVSTEPGKGTKFSMWLPFLEVQEKVVAIGHEKTAA